MRYVLVYLCRYFFAIPYGAKCSDIPVQMHKTIKLYFFTKGTVVLFVIYRGANQRKLPRVKIYTYIPIGGNTNLAG